VRKLRNDTRACATCAGATGQLGQDCQRARRGERGGGTGMGAASETLVWAGTMAHRPLAYAAAEGDPAPAPAALFAKLYEDLRRLASRQLARAAGGLTLETTTLLHEAYLDMAGRDGAHLPERGQFMAYAARVMRSLIIDYARERRAQKRGGRFELTALASEVPDPASDRVDGEGLARIGAAIDELADVEPALARTVDLKFFCGFSFGEIAAMEGVSERTVQRHWERARIYLRGRLDDAEAPL
jgi:RNA polymerase sigma factor (TIGR02999 family)